MKEHIQVVIAEDIEPLRKKYVSVLEADPHIHVVADVHTGIAAYEQVLEYTPDVVLLDIEMETQDAGIRAISNILSFSPEIRIIVLTVHEEDDLVFSAFKLGAHDYILKNAKDTEIRQAVINAYHNKSYIRPKIAQKLRTEFRRVKTYEGSFLFMLNVLATLSPRELDTLYLITQGYTRKEVCALRYIEMSTLKSQIHSILKKFHKRKMKDVITSESDRQLLELIVKNHIQKEYGQSIELLSEK